VSAQEPQIPAMPAQPGAATAVPGGLLVPGQRVIVQGDGQGAPVVLQPPPRIIRDEGIPDEVIPLVGMIMGIVMTMVILFPIARAIGRWIDRRTDRSLVRIAEVAPQLRTLQESVDAMAIELERISEAQRFTAKLMAGQAQKVGAGEQAQP
jgi:hypothetical protein